MSPYVQALKFWPVDQFLAAQEWHYHHGIVISTPELFVMARPVCSTWNSGQMADITQSDPSGDCWYVWLACGSMAHVMDLAPIFCRKPFVSFHRPQAVDCPLVVMDALRAMRLCSGFAHSRH